MMERFTKVLLFTKFHAKSRAVKPGKMPFVETLDPTFKLPMNRDTVQAEPM